MSFAVTLRNTLERIERLEAAAWREDAALGLRDYVIIRGMQRYGAALFGLNCLALHAFGLADPRTMNFPSVLEDFVGFHVAGGLIGVFLWSRNRWKYGAAQPPEAGSGSGAT